MKASFERREFPLEHPFTIARGTQETAANVVVRVEDDEGNVGVGGAAPSAHYGETAGTVEAVMPELLAVVERADDPHDLARIETGMREVVADNPAARAAVSIACHDLAAKRADLPLYRYWGLDAANTLDTSFTIGIDDEETMRRKTAEAVEAGYGTLKVKLGTSRDEQLLAAVRETAPDATIRVDANEAWTPKEAVRNIEWLADYGVEFVEQPVPAENREGLKYVYERSPLPIAADESCVVASDVPEVADRCDIANLKLMKTGGLREAKRLIHAARAHGLEVMCGCMIESNASIAAAAHLAPLLDYADLDGSLLLAEDDFDGVPMPAGHVDLQAVERAGTGAREA
ncbi:homolog to dipeptide epimerase [Halobacterium hubeiense]|uniref:Homolog to dipeptide epimerase n=1 Tax=Halobacterium hubeiense TaxID=1407499 RepID=A0A0U5H491_9EURY|nr:dipeptide epimerase [Halobacterium hubeiense]CQH59545.1 homolog to dipeptide epimerase [Halobacterium hubeiense]